MLRRKMMSHDRKYSPLLTDLYQLTMAFGYWKNRIHERRSVFHLHFRKNPFQGGYSICCGLADAVDYLESFHFTEEELGYLAGLTGNDGAPLFDTGFLAYLKTMQFACDIDAVPEGTAVFPHEPLVRVTGPVLQCQLLETALLNIVNFQTLIATKAARVCEAAQGDPVLEFGLRRAQGVDGGMAASRAAYIGGCAATSNVLAGMRFGIPVKGTHAHSWVMSFDSEEESFEAYAAALPNNCVFLVDTYNTIEGVRTAARVATRMRGNGHEMAGIRLDSGDLAYLSIEARRLLDEAGFPNAAVIASNDLDEGIIASLKAQGARVAVWGVGTKLVTAYDQPAMGGVYKLAASAAGDGAWNYTVKLSETAVKVSNPGVQQIRRFEHEGYFIGDMIFNEAEPIDSADDTYSIIDPSDDTRTKTMPVDACHEDLLQPVFRDGKLVAPLPGIHAIRERVRDQLSRLHPGIRRFLNPHAYPVGLEPSLFKLKHDLIMKARHQVAGTP